MTPFVILSLPRSGTQLLTAHLNKHPDIRAHGEILNQIDETVTTDDIVWRCWQQPDTKQAVGATILAEQLQPRPFLLADLLAVTGMRVIVLERANQLERLRSVEQAGTVWDWSVDHPPHQLPAVELHPKLTLRALKAATLWHRELTKIRNPLCWIYYEQLVDSPVRTLDAIYNLLDVTYPGPLLETGTWKQETRPLADTVTNMTELRQELASTRYAL